MKKSKMIEELREVCRNYTYPCDRMLRDVLDKQEELGIIDSLWESETDRSTTNGVSNE